MSTAEVPSHRVGTNSLSREMMNNSSHDDIVDVIPPSALSSDILSSSTNFNYASLQGVVKTDIETASLTSTEEASTTTNGSDQQTITTHIPSKITREPLRFHFKGYTLWLELEEFPLPMDTVSTKPQLDLRHVLQKAAQEQNVESIPSPHVTLFYGMEHFETEEEVLQRFNGELRGFFQKLSRETQIVGAWPCPLKPIGMMQDVSYDGVDGEDMDMAWQEITYATCNDHERMLDEIYHIMYKTKRDKDARWKPHLSLAYDNPEETTLSLSNVLSLVSRYPSLMKERKIHGISLWSTIGVMKD